MTFSMQIRMEDTGGSKETSNPGTWLRPQGIILSTLPLLRQSRWWGPVWCRPPPRPQLHKTCSPPGTTSLFLYACLKIAIITLRAEWEDRALWWLACAPSRRWMGRYLVDNQTNVVENSWLPSTKVWLLVHSFVSLQGTREYFLVNVSFSRLRSSRLLWHRHQRQLHGLQNPSTCHRPESHKVSWFFGKH